MAQYNGYVDVAHNTYDAFRSATLGNGYNVDNQDYNQCWDFCALLWHQYGLTLITKAGGGTARECWTNSRYANAVPPFTSLEGRENILRGDCVVFWNGDPNSAGHIAFADQDWADNNNGYLNFLGQNQGQGIYAPSNIASLNTNIVIGIFRNTNWNGTPPEPPISYGKMPALPIVTAINYWWNDEE